MKYSRILLCSYRSRVLSSWLSLGLAVACSARGVDIGSSRNDDHGGEMTTAATSTTDPADASPHSEVSQAVEGATVEGATVEPSASLGPGESPQSQETANPSPECVPPPGEFVDVLSISFVNHTDTALYLASSNDDCGVPAYVELRRDGEKVEIYDGTCALDCEVIRSGGQGIVERPPADCNSNPYCDAPVKIIHPNTNDGQSVLPVLVTMYDVPGSCFPDGANVTCQVQHALSAGKYTLIARAYTELECGGEPCECYQEVGGSCLPTGDVLPQGAGELRTVEVELDFDPQKSGLSVQFDFN